MYMDSLTHGAYIKLFLIWKYNPEFQKESQMQHSAVRCNIVPLNIIHKQLLKIIISYHRTEHLPELTTAKLTTVKLSFCSSPTLLDWKELSSLNIGRKKKEMIMFLLKPLDNYLVKVFLTEPPQNQ